MALEYMTQAGYDKLKKELADALAQRPVISAAIAEAREKGDLSENAEYDAARDAQGLLEVKIARLKEKVTNARVIDESKVEGVQLDLFEETVDTSRERNRQEAILEIRRKFGNNAILTGIDFEEGATTRERNNQIGGHRK